MPSHCERETSSFICNDELAWDHYQTLFLSVANFKRTSLLCDDVPEIGANFVVPAVKARKISNILW